MNLRRQLAIAILVMLTAAVAFAQDQGDPLATVQRLYESAEYAEALAVLARLDDPAIRDRIDEYRTLCLLGLKRTRDAEEILEHLVARRPSSMYDTASFPPKFVSLHADVKRRMLPIVAGTLFTTAKASFDAELFASAARLFTELNLLLAEAPDPASVGDLKMLADGFLKLSEERVAALAAPVPEAPRPEPVATIAPPVSAPSSPPKDLYDSEDLDVVPPEIIDQRMPKWRPPHDGAMRVFRGALEVIVGQHGSVESGAISQPTFPTYDTELLRVARQWRYIPAMKEGKPVRYRKHIVVTLVP